MTMTNATSPTPADRARPSWQSIRRIIGERVDAKRSAGIVLGVVDSDGRRVAAYGDPGPGQPPLDASSVFEIGSITKVFTAALLADMVVRGEVALDEPVALLLPQTVRVPTWGERQIELVDLATQTSGLPRLPANWRWGDSAHPMMAGYTVGMLYEFLSGYTLTRQIGSEYQYSNLGFGLLGHALALRAGGGGHRAGRSAGLPRHRDRVLREGDPTRAHLPARPPRCGHWRRRALRGQADAGKQGSGSRSCAGCMDRENKEGLTMGFIKGLGEQLLLRGEGRGFAGPSDPSSRLYRLDVGRHGRRSGRSRPSYCLRPAWVRPVGG